MGANGPVTRPSPITCARWLVVSNYLVICLVLQSQFIVWDGYLYLLAVGTDRDIDPTHLLYVPCLEFLDAIARPLGLPLERTATLFSCAAGAATLALLWRALVRLGADEVAGALVAGLVVTSSALWACVESVEVYAPAVAAIALAWYGAVRYRESQGGRDLLLTAVGVGLGIGFHLAALLAVPALWFTLFGMRSKLPRAHRKVITWSVSAVVVAGIAIAFTIDLATRFRYPLSLLRSPAEIVAELPGTAELLAGFYWQSVPELVSLAAIGWVLGLVRRTRAWWSASLWFATGAITYLVLGASYFGILLPSLLPLAMLAAQLTATKVRWMQRPVGRSAALLVLAVALVSSIARAFPDLHRAATQPDPHRELAIELSKRIEHDVTLFANVLHHPLAFFTDAQTVSVAELRRRAENDPDLAHLPSGQRTAELLRRQAAAQIASRRRPFLLDEGLQFLLGHGVVERDLSIDRRRLFKITKHERAHAYAMFGQRRPDDIPVTPLRPNESEMNRCRSLRAPTRPPGRC